LTFLPPPILGEAPLKLWGLVFFKLDPFPITRQSFAAIGRGTSEITLVMKQQNIMVTHLRTLRKSSHNNSASLGYTV